MADSLVPDRIKKLREHKSILFDKTLSLVNLWQEIADNFYIERADFTVQRYLGQDYAANLLTSHPLITRRTLGDTIGQMLRDETKDWFKIDVLRDDLTGEPEKQWLEWMTKVMKRAMYGRKTRFEEAAKQGDHDFATFGQCVISVEMNRTMDDLLYRCWHLRDVRWVLDENGDIGKIYRQWDPEATILAQTYNGKNGRGMVSDKVMKLVNGKQPYEKVRCVHVVMRADEYESPVGKKWKTPWVSIMYEEESGHILEEKGIKTKRYCIPRWVTVSGSQYAFSPATVCGLPDARLIQSMTLTLLEAGELAVRPAMVTPGDVLRSDIQLFSGGVTVYDAEYDETTGEVLRPINIPKDGISFGVQMAQNTKQDLENAFYLNKIGMPPRGGPQETAFEVGQRVNEWIRQALPLFSPMQKDYNGELCELTLETLLSVNAFGSMRNMPKSLRGADTRFTFTGPLNEAIDQQKGQLLQEAGTIITNAVANDPSTRFILNTPYSVRDALHGIGVPARWFNDEKTADAMNQTAQQQAQISQAIDLAQKGGDAAQSVGAAGKALQSMQGGGQAAPPGAVPQ